MHVLVTAGNTAVMIDRVRCLTNIFSGRTGAAIALCAHERGHHVTLLTSHPEAIAQLHNPVPGPPRWDCIAYRTFVDLYKLLVQHIGVGASRYDVVIHCAAVSDYLSAGVFAPAAGTAFEPGELTWHGLPPRLQDRKAGKVKSDEPELWLRLVRAPKLIDRIRLDWGFTGILVKFKLEVDVSDDKLREIAETSRLHSGADWMVANTLEGAANWAYLGNGAAYERVSRAELPQRLLEAIERGRRGNG